MFNVILKTCCGLDVHQAVIWACLLIEKADGTVQRIKNKFGTCTKELLRLHDWLEKHNCKHVAMESTGVYWKPVYNILEDSCDLTVANARHIKNLPGRKTDVKDCEWVAILYRHGLIRKSFVPPRAIRDLRDLTRYRRRLVDQAADEKNRIQKFLEDANIKLSSVVSKIWGKSCQKMLEALIIGHMTAKEMAQLARGRMRPKIKELELALEGNVTEHHRYMLGKCMKHIRSIEDEIAELDERIDKCLQPYRAQHQCLMEIIGVDEKSAAALLAEIGVDMSFFPTSHHLASWAGVCPGNNESGGKKKSGKTAKGNKWLNAVLTEMAWAASKKKDSFAQAKFNGIAARRGKKKANVALRHHILKSAWHILQEPGVVYMEPEIKPLTEKRKEKIIKKHLNAIKKLGYYVTVDPVEAITAA
jgi:transposase